MTDKRVEHLRDSEPKAKGKNDACERYRECDVSMGAEMAEIEFQSDQEHQQDQPDLAQHTKDECDGRLKHLPKQIREKATEQGWPEDQAGSDFSAHLRLTEVAKDHTENPSGRHDDNQLDDYDQ